MPTVQSDGGSSSVVTLVYVRLTKTKPAQYLKSMVDKAKEVCHPQTFNLKDFSLLMFVYFRQCILIIYTPTPQIYFHIPIHSSSCLRFFFKCLKSKVCCPKSLGCGANFWIMVDLPCVTLFKRSRTLTLSSYQLPIGPQLRSRTWCPPTLSTL